MIGDDLTFGHRIQHGRIEAHGERLARFDLRDDDISLITRSGIRRVVGVIDTGSQQSAAIEHLHASRRAHEVQFRDQDVDHVDLKGRR